MAGELPAIEAWLAESGEHAGCAMAIGGMSAGGMAAMVRLCRPHPYAAALVECSTGSWRWQQGRAMHDPARVGRLDPVNHLADWRDIPFLALHNELDEWVPVAGQREFVDALRARASAPGTVRMHAFGRCAADAKDRGTAFLAEALLPRT